MGIRQVIATLHRLVSDGIIREYVLGGPVGAAFTIGPFSTIDVDVFINMGPQFAEREDRLEPIRSALVTHGGRIVSRVLKQMRWSPFAAPRRQTVTANDNYVSLFDWRVRLFPIDDVLTGAATTDVAEVEIDGITVRVLPLEQIAVIALHRGCHADLELLMFLLEYEALDQQRFEDLVVQAGLGLAWIAFKADFFGGASGFSRFRKSAKRSADENMPISEKLAGLDAWSDLVHAIRRTAPAA